jgi:heme exporter protein B
VLNPFATLVTLVSLAKDRVEREEKGATAVEYGLLVGLIAVAIIATLLLLGPQLTGAVIVRLAAVLALADLGIAVIGTLVGALAIQTRARDLIGPLVALPLLLPVVIGAARAIAPVLSEAGAGALEGRWLGLLGLYDLVFGLIAYAVFDFLLED